MAKLMVQAALHRFDRIPVGGGYRGQLGRIKLFPKAFGSPKCVDYQIARLPVEAAHPTRAWQPARELQPSEPAPFEEAQQFRIAAKNLEHIPGRLLGHRRVKAPYVHAHLKG
jgi:hypothetical protein